ncbi:MAG: hypothetical protein ACPLSY_03340 [Moorellaceae bacterium]
MAVMNEEAKEQRLPDFHLSPWDILVAKLNLIEKGLENLERQIVKLEQRVEREISNLHEEIKDTKSNVRSLEQRFDGFEQWFVDRAKNERHNFLVLEITMILGFLTILLTTIAPYLVALIKH